MQEKGRPEVMLRDLLYHEEAYSLPERRPNNQPNHSSTDCQPYASVSGTFEA